MLDRAFPGIGRVHRASGMRNAAQFRAFNDALTLMAQEPAGRDWIRALQHGDVTPLDVYAKYRKNEWQQGPDKPILAQPLVKALADWRTNTRAEVSDDTYRVRKELVTKVALVAHHDTVAHTAAVMARLRVLMATTPASFNLLRNYARAFLRDTVGERHPVYQDLKFDVKPIAIPQHAHVKERKRHPLTPAQVQLLASTFSTTQPGGGPGATGHGSVAIGMAITGMHPKEYWGAWDQGPIGVHVHGTKRAGRDRMIPRLFPSMLWPHPMLKRATVTRASFARAFRAAATAAKLTCTPLDLRRSFANWMAACGIPENYRRIYRGHGAKSMADVYETPEFKRDLAEHGAQLVAWVNAQLVAAAAGPQLVARDGAR